MSRFITYVFFISFFIINNAQAFEEVYVTNDAITEKGLVLESVADWLSKKSVDQDENGEEYFDFLDNRLYLDPDQNGNRLLNPFCVQLKNPSQSERDLKITFISINSQCLGESTLPVWKLKYVIKDLDDFEEETKNLTFVQINSKVRWLLEHPVDFPKPLFALPYTFNYMDKDENDLYFIVLDAAQGKSYRDIIKNESMDNIIKAFEKLGTAFGNMHSKFMDLTTLLSNDLLMDNNFEDNPLKRNEKKTNDYYKTLNHGDAHGGNVYFDIATNQVEVIDNDSFVTKKTEMHSIENDLFSIFISFFDGLNKEEECVSSFSAACTNANVAMQSFFKNYVLAFQQKERKAMRYYINFFLENHILSSGTNTSEKINTVYFKPFILSSIDNAIQEPIIIRPSEKENEKKKRYEIQKPIKKPDYKKNKRHELSIKKRHAKTSKKTT